MNNYLLELYFHKYLEAAALLPAPAVFQMILRTGHLFRRWKTYGAWFEPGVLMKAMESMALAGILPRHSVKSAVREYLRFESRLVVENIWIRKKNARKLLRSFSPPDVALLREYGRSGPYVIVTAHTSALYPLVALLDILGLTSPFLCNNAMRQPYESATPLQRNVMKTMTVWGDYQPLFFVEDGDVIKRSLSSICSGTSVVVPQDVPGYSGRGVKVLMFGEKLWSPTGPAKLAHEAGVSMLLAIGWASGCAEPYQIFFRKIAPTGDFSSDMQSVCEGIEEAVKKGPSCWGGWLYFDKMAI